MAEVHTDGTHDPRRETSLRRDSPTAREQGVTTTVVSLAAVALVLLLVAALFFLDVF